MIRDLRLAFRSLRRSTAFAAAAVLSLGLGLGASAAILGVVRAVLLRPLPFREPERLVLVQHHTLRDETTRFEVSYPDYAEWRRRVRSLSSLAAVPSTVGRMVWEEGGVGEPVNGAPVASELFGVLGVEPALGRTFTPEEDRIGAERVVVLGNGVWRRRFGGDPRVVGRRVRLDGRPHTVVGVMPPGFEYPRGAEVWVALVPAVDSLAQNEQIQFLDVVGRLAPGATVAQAAAELDGIVDQVTNPRLTPELAIGAHVTPLEEELTGAARAPLLGLLAAAALVLLVACANVANLLLARAAERRSELALRRALGAGGARLVRELLAEGVVLAAAGAVLGIVLGEAALRTLLASAPLDLYRGADAGVDAAAGVLVGLLALGAALAVAAAPALSAARAHPAEALAGAGRTGGTRRERTLARAFVAGEIALALVLLAGAALLLRDLARLARAELGFERERVLTVQLFLPEDPYADPARARAFQRDALERIRALPGAEGAAGVLLRPLEGPDGFDYPFTVEGQTAREQARNPLVNYEAVTPGYFPTMGIPLLAGRDVTEADAPEAPGVVVVSRSLAERYWPGGALGRRLKWGGPESPAPWLTVVGVVGDARYRGLEPAPAPDAYVPYGQTPWTLAHLVVRSAGDPAALVGAVRREIAALDPGAHAVDPATMETMVARQLRRPRLGTGVLVLFASAALALGAVGVYGLASRGAVRRTREVGIRVAVGADPGRIRRLLVGEAARVAALGILAGLAGSAAAIRLLASRIGGLRSPDPLLVLGAGVFLAAVAILAAWLPARRLARVEAAAALRTE
jgi:putative ABC transport system permease protein